MDVNKLSQHDGDREHELPLAASDDTTLDAGTESDEGYLNQLGYKQELDRALGLVSTFGIAFSAISIASAIYVTLGVGFAFFGPASLISFAIGAALQVFAVGLAIAELVSAYPLSGGVYQIVNRVSQRPWLGWMSGWWIQVAHIVSVAAVAVAISPFIAHWFGVEFASASDSLPWVIGLIVLSTIVNLIGVRVAAVINNLGVLAEVIGAVVIVVALLVVQHDYQPLSIVTDTGGTTGNGWLLPLMFAFALPAWVISSFDSAGNAGEETHDAARKAPLGLFIANSASWVFGVAFFFLLVISIPDVQEVMASATPAKVILESAVGQTITAIFETLAILALFANNCIIQLTGVRVTWSQARDGQMPFANTLRRVNSRRVPVAATLVTAALSMVFAVWSSALLVLGAVVGLTWALAYGVAVIVGFRAVVAGSLPRHPFTTGRAAPVVFAVASVWSVFLCVAIAWTDFVLVGGGTLVTTLVGVAIYFCIPSSRRGKIPGVTLRGEPRP